MPFKKGISGNPGGRPKKTKTLLEIEALARQYAPQARIDCAVDHIGR
jgi:hypothetical protein